MDKIKISQKELDDIYEIEKTIEEPKANEELQQDNTEPQFLTEEEQQQDKHLEESIGWVQPKEEE